MTSGSGLRGVQRWLAHRDAGAQLELVCAEHPRPERGPSDRDLIRLSACARELVPAEIVELLTLGAARVTIRLDGCDEAAAAAAHLEPILTVLRAGGVDRVSVERVARTSGVADGGRDHRTSAVPRRRRVLDAAQMPVSRRQLFGLRQAETPALPPDAATPHTRLVAAVRAVTTPTAALEGLDGPAAHLTARGCTACGTCVAACPADALELRHGPGGDELAISTLLQVPARCDGCARCVRLCPAEVLTAAGRWSWERLRTDAEVPVATVSTTHCVRCGARFPVSTGGRYCAVCATRRSDPFGSTMPPAVGASSQRRSMLNRSATSAGLPGSGSS